MFFRFCSITGWKGFLEHIQSNTHIDTIENVKTVAMFKMSVMNWRIKAKRAFYFTDRSKKERMYIPICNKNVHLLDIALEYIPYCWKVIASNLAYSLSSLRHWLFIKIPLNGFHDWESRRKRVEFFGQLIDYCLKFHLWGQYWAKYNTWLREYKMN